MVAFPKSPEQKLIDAVYKSYEKTENLSFSRLGASGIGEECIRKIWFNWRGFSKKQFEGRMLRLFETGHLQEDRVIQDLIRSGKEVYFVNEYGSQYEFEHDSGHFICKVDGVIKHQDKNHLLEIKTHNKKSFSALQRHGVEKSKPVHYSQMQISMYLGHFTRGLYVSLCKDDEHYYIEKIKEDKAHQKSLIKKIESLINARMRPTGISEDASIFACKFCDHKDVCVKETKPLFHCRSCVNAIPINNGGWNCDLHGTLLNKQQQLIGCEDYQAL
jgi:hypothetical protein